MIRNAAGLGVHEMHVAVGVGERERRYLDRGVTIDYVLFSDRREEVGLRDWDLLICWF